jgi:hypothetical protein
MLQKAGEHFQLGKVTACVLTLAGNGLFHDFPSE